MRLVALLYKLTEVLLMRDLLVSVAVGSIIFLSPAWVAATPPQVSAGWAYVDGIAPTFTGEWNLANDFFANMYRAGDPTKPLESKLYLRYSCKTMTMYALVLVEPNGLGYIDLSATTAWIAVNSLSRKVVNEVSSNNGVPPDFAWIGRGFDGNPQHVLGYEASFPITKGNYYIIAHINVWSFGQQTSATVGSPGVGPPFVVPDCSVAVEPSTWGSVKGLYR